MRDDDARRPTRRKPPQVRFDRYSIFGIGRECRLNAYGRWLLEALCHLSDYKSHCYVTTLAELSEDTGIGTDTIRKTLDAFTRPSS